NTYEDMFESYILGMDTFALGLIKAAEIIEDGRIDGFIKDKYSSFESGIGAQIVSGNATLESLSDYAVSLKMPDVPASGKQERLEGIVNNILFG
ncbi:MAG: xylose isomerase, partial [Clostridia bacterium]|nr:xylose isomerase [Clostridia bacterium]